MERVRGKEEAERIEGETSRREKSVEVHNKASKRNLDDNWNGKGRHL